MTVLVFSPHLDDAVLSVPLHLLRAHRLGHRCVVATVFSRGREEEQRQCEDRSALSVLGAESLHLGYWDAPERLGLAREAHALLLTALDPSDVAPIATEMARLVGALRPAAVWLPLGVGEHLDHRVVHHAGSPFATAFFEDRPYACVRHATAARLCALGARSEPVGPSAAQEFVAASRAASFADAYLPKETDAVLEALSWPLRQSAPCVLRDDSATLEGEAAEMAPLSRAISGYTSQIVPLFAGQPPLSILADRDRIYRERLHKLTPVANDGRANTMRDGSKPSSPKDRDRR